MKGWGALLAAALIGAAGCSSDESSPVARPPVPPAAPAPPEAPDPGLAKALIPEDATPLRIHRHLKLGDFRPSDRYGGKADTLVIRDEASFRDVLTRHLARGRADEYVKWNHIDFAKQVVFIVSWAESESGGGGKIDSVWKSSDRITISVAMNSNWGGNVCQVFCNHSDGVVVNRSDLPVEFVWR